jgi:hypothetical protein
MDRFTSVKEQFWRDKLTFPLFAPDRIVSQWKRLDAAAIRLDRRVEDFGQSASFVWYRGDT